MRGHIGFKIPRYPELDVTQFVADVLRAGDQFQLAPTIHVTQFAADQLVYKEMQAVTVSQLVVDVLTYDNT